MFSKRALDEDIFVAASENSGEDILRGVSEGRMDVNSRDASSATPLMLAATLGRDFAASILIQKVGVWKPK